MIGTKTLCAIALALLVAWGAHDSGKPWWIDHPFMGDAFDVGTLAFLVFRCLFGLFDREPPR